MKEYDETKYFLMSRKLAKFHKWVSYLTTLIGYFAVALAALLVFLWAVLQVLTAIFELF